MKGKKIIIVVAILVAIFIILALLGPSHYKITRSITIKAPVEKVYEQTSIFKNWAQWSPWAKADTAATYAIEKDEQLPGSKMSWNGPISGVGSMTAVEVATNQKFIYNLVFTEPWYMAMNSHGGFIYTSNADSVNVEWYDEGDIGFMSRPMMLFFNIEGQIGPMFEEGLLEIKTICESSTTGSPIAITEEQVERKTILYIKEGASLTEDSIALKLGEAYGEIMAFIGVNKLSVTDVPMTITTEFSLQKMYWAFNAAIPVELSEEIELFGRIKLGETYEGKVVKGVHVGPHANSMITYNAIEQYMKRHNLEENGMPFEEFVDDPGVVAEDKMRTFIYFPIK